VGFPPHVPAGKLSYRVIPRARFYASRKPAFIYPALHQIATARYLLCCEV
jgi:hypothetical protein